MKRSILLIFLFFSIGLNIYLYVRLQNHGVTVFGNSIASSDEKPFLEDTRSQHPHLHSLDIDSADSLFQQQLFTEAVAGLKQLMINDPTSAEQLRQRWYGQLLQWMELKEFALIEVFNAAYLLQFDDDLDFLIIRAERLAATGFLLESIYQYYALMVFFDGQSNEITLRHRVHQIVNQQIVRFKQQMAWQALIDFIQPILHKEPDYPPYILALAEAQINLNLFQQAEEYLLPLLHEDLYGNYASDLLDKIRLQDLKEQAVQLKPYGEHYLVDGLINREQKITLLIDTGASLSTLSQNSFTELLNIYTAEFVTETTINTAGGEIYAPIYRFQYFQIDEYQVKNMEFAILQFSEIPGADGLLGMNFLRNFQFSIDQQNKLLRLAPN